MLAACMWRQRAAGSRYSSSTATGCVSPIPTTWPTTPMSSPWTRSRAAATFRCSALRAGTLPCWCARLADRLAAAETRSQVHGKTHRGGVFVIIWLNGAFGAGKTTTARHLAGWLEDARLFDAELVGYLLMAALDDHEFQDFQDLPPWRELVPVVTEKITGFTGQHLIATQTVLSEAYWAELAQGFRKTSLEIFHVLLHVDSRMLAARIKADELDATACQWRLDHIGDYEKS